MFQFKSLLFLLISSAVVLSFSGCGVSKYSIASKSTESSIINTKDKAYAVFGVEELGGGRHNPIFEYFPETETFKLVAIMFSHEKYIYPLDEGIHYFYSMGGERHDFVKIEASKGKKYFVNIGTNAWAWSFTTLIEFEPTTDKDLIRNIKKKTLIDNSEKSVKWFNDRKNDSKFKTKVKARFSDWKENDMDNQTLYKKDGFPIK